MSKKSCVSLNIGQKLAILNSLKEKSRSKNELAKDYGCDPTTIYRIMEDEAKIRETAFLNGNLKSCRKRKGNYDDLNTAVSKWFHEQRAKKAVISGPMIMEKASTMAQLMNIEFEVKIYPSK